MARRKLTKVQQEYVIHALANFEPDDEILTRLKTDCSVKLRRVVLTYYRKNHAVEIEKVRAELETRFKSIRTANKYQRLKTRDKLINDIMRR